MNTNTDTLPPAEQGELNLGYLRLTDSAPVILAAELGLYERYGLNVTLQREVSWANVRDKLVAGALDAAQMLAPLPLATTLGCGGLRANVLTGLVLSLNGNAITLSSRLWNALSADEAITPGVAAASAQALGRYVTDNSERGPLTFAAAHSFSCHSFQLRRWLRTGGIDPDRDVRMIALPPEQMVDSLARGIIDGYCVGEPWNSAAVQSGIGFIAATGYDIHNNLIEKVLGVTAAWHEHHPATHLRLRMALMEACRWLADDANRMEAIPILARPQYLDLPESLLSPSLRGELQWERHGAVTPFPHFHVFGRFQAGFPWRSTAREYVQETLELIGRKASADEAASASQQVYRPDLYRDAARRLGLPLPLSDDLPAIEHDDTWHLAPGLEMGPDRRLTPGLVSD